jgi:DNA-binding NarL/FixJ family response regulator
MLRLLRRFAKGNTNKQIAQELGIKESVITDQRSKIMRSLQITSQAKLVVMTDRLAFWPIKNKGAAAPLSGSPPQHAVQY